VGQNQVVPVAIVAGGGDDKSGFKQTSSVDALGVVFHNIMFRRIVYPGYNLALPVTFPAKERNIHLEGTGFRVGIVQDIMVSMALLAARGIGIIHQEGLSVNAPGVI
jgi:hypothetical protein